MNEKHAINMFLIAVLKDLFLVLFLIIFCKFYLCMPLAIPGYIVLNGRINSENDLEIMTKEGIIKAQRQYLPGGTRENSDP